MKTPFRRVVWLSLLGLLPLLAIVVLLSGVVPVAASSGHFAVTAWVLKFAMRRSVATHSMGISAPKLKDERLLLIGAGHYESACRFCHGAPGIAPPPAVAGATPAPPALTHAAQRYDAAELFYIVRHGVKFTGMPAWPSSVREDEVWPVIAFLQAWPDLDRAKYDGLVFGSTRGQRPPGAPLSLERCARCHGTRGQGRGEAFPVLAAQNREYLHASLTAYAEGKRPSAIMQQHVHLTDGELRKLAEWFAQQPPAQPRGTSSESDESYRWGRALARQGVAARKIPSCNDCHGPKGTMRNAYPLLSGQPSSYLRQQLQLFSAGTRGGSPYASLMDNVQAHALEPDEIQAVAAYYSSLAVDSASDGNEAGSGSSNAQQH